MSDVTNVAAPLGEDRSRGRLVRRRWRGTDRGARGLEEDEEIVGADADADEDTGEVERGKERHSQQERVDGVRERERRDQQCDAREGEGRCARE